MANHLVQLLLPITDNDGRPFPQHILEKVKEALVDKFGGLTAFERSPARGVWAPESAQKQHEDVITIEVMVDRLDAAWWKDFRQTLERQLRQQEIVVRAFPMRSI